MNFFPTLERPTNEAPPVRSDAIARNATLNLVGHSLPVVVGVFTIPFIVRRLGLDAFGVLSVAWALLGYLGLFDLGLGRATTNAFARDLEGGRQERLPLLFWTSLRLSLLLGILGGCALAGLSNVLVDKALKLPLALTEDARWTFLTLAVSLPAVLTSSMLRGVLEAGQRFDLLNAIRIPTSASMFLLPAIALWLGSDLPGVAALLACSNVAGCLAYLGACFRAFANVRAIQPLDWAIARSFLTYGGWVTVGNALGPVIVYLDRFLIGALISTAAVAFYAAPYEIVTRLWILPASLVSTLFPVFSATSGKAFPYEHTRLYARSQMFILLTVGSSVVLIVVFAAQILNVWLGPAFAAEASSALRILAIGVLVNSVAQVSYTFIQASGRPDAIARLYVGELFVYVPIAWILIAQWGITGAALAWTLRAAADALLLHEVAARLQPATRSAPRRREEERQGI